MNVRTKILSWRIAASLLIWTPELCAESFGTLRSVKSTGNIVRAPRPMAPASMRRSLSHGNLRTSPRALSNQARFVGYHGTMKEGMPKITRGLAGYTSSPENQLGPGLYTGDLRTAAVYGRGGAIYEVYAENFSNMHGTEPPVEWTRGVWNLKENQVYLKTYDFLEAKHIEPYTMRESRQIKFNPRAYSQLTFKPYTGAVPKR